MNLPNLLTLSRVPLMFIVVALMYAEFAWASTAAFWLFIAAALTDWLDGKIARERGEVSSFGRFMDSVIDKVMVLGLMIAPERRGELHGPRHHRDDAVALHPLARVRGLRQIGRAHV